MFSRREFLKAAGLTGAALGGVPFMPSLCCRAARVGI